MTKRGMVLLISIFTLLFFTACDNGTNDEDVVEVIDDNTDDTNSASGEYSTETIAEAMESNKTDHEEAEDASWDAESATTITLNGNSIEVSGSGAIADGSYVTISAAGTYLLQGVLNDGQIIVDTEDEETVKIVLNNVEAANSTNAPFNVISAEKVVVILPEGTENHFEDTANYIFEDEEEDEPNATFFSKADLSFYGTGTLSVDANYNDAITSKDGLLIDAGTFEISSADDGIRGKDYLIIKGGNFTVHSEGDAFKSDEDDDEDKGYILIEGGNFDITAAGDGFAAESDFLVAEGTFELVTGGGSDNYDEDISAKGMKSRVLTVIEKGDFVINSADDGVHSDGTIVIHDGTFTIATGDDGIHADVELAIHTGNINITESYEGLESDVIYINDGEIHVTASDDGINGAGDSEETGTGHGGFEASGNSYLYINGGYIVVDASGDGIDVNGSFEMSGGTVLVNGPTERMNGSLDYDRSFKLTGGVLVAAGSSGMVQTPGSTSTQSSVLLNLQSQQSANTLFHIQKSDGTEVFTFAPAKRYQSVVFSSSLLEDGESYDVYIGGSSTGTVTDGVFEGGSYSAGTKVGTVTLSGSVTTVSQ
ncbi:carbohydrate-binding domain-containing protein [Limibacter armeniacum]|uniref:carbohydrate-binding domain-containing protein n=1 Tax=Limibacter armeniacum TaxID=466084 RepID=UPI002FE67A3C